MSSWSEAPARGMVLRGGAAGTVRPARLDSELRTTAFAPTHVVDARLTDPHLERVVADVAADARARGHAEGFTAGYAEGLAAAAAEAAVTAQRQAAAATAAQADRDAQLQAALAVLGTATDAFRAREAVSVGEVEDVVVDLALKVAQAVLDRELTVAQDPGRDAVRRALALAPHDAPATVRLHPDDVAALGDLDDLAAGRPVTVVSDPSVERGGCVADAAGRRIDAQIGAAVARVAAALR